MKPFQRRGARVAPLLLACACICSGRAAAQSILPDTTALTFHGIPAGASLAQLSDHIRRLSGFPLRCLRSRRDRSVQECRSSYLDAAGGLTVELWLSAIDSLSGIITLKSTSGSTQLAQWRDHLQQRYGMVPVNVQGPQRMLQWVRRGRMIRLTWRREGSAIAMSVSLVDGRVLDRWGQKKE